MAGSVNNDDALIFGQSESGRSSTETHQPVENPQQQQQYSHVPPESNVNPSVQQPQPPQDYPASELSQTGPYQQEPWYVNNNNATWQQQQQPPAGAPLPAYPPQQQGYQAHPQATPAGYSNQQQPQYQPQQSGTSAYNNPGPTRPPPPPGGYHPHQQQSPVHHGFAPPTRTPPGQAAVAPRTPYMPSATIRPDLGPPMPWTSDIFGFLQDCHGCCLSVLAPCITFGQIAEIMDSGYNTCATAGVIYALACLFLIPCLYSYTYRTKMRYHFNLRPDPLDDLCLHFWCEPCALSQEYRELAYRGIDPSLGYAMQQDVISRAMANPVSLAMNAPDEMSMKQ